MNFCFEQVCIKYAPDGTSSVQESVPGPGSPCSPLLHPVFSVRVEERSRPSTVDKKEASRGEGSGSGAPACMSGESRPGGSGPLLCPEGCWFDSQSWHLPGLQVRSLAGACTGGYQWMLFSLQCFSSLYACPQMGIKQKRCFKGERKKSQHLSRNRGLKMSMRPSDKQFHIPFQLVHVMTGNVNELLVQHTGRPAVTSEL